MRVDNQNKYSKERALHLISGAFLGLAFLFFPRKKNRIIFNSTHNRSYNFNTRYLFEYFLKQNGWESRFVINDDDLRSQLNAEIGPYFISSRGVLNKIFCLNAAAWITSSLETPVGGLFLSYRRLVYHLSHGTPIRAIGLVEKKAPFYKKIYYKIIGTNFSHYLATSTYTTDFVQRAFACPSAKVVIQGQPRIEPLVKVRSQKNNAPKKILYAPTWRPKDETLLFPFPDLDLKRLNDFLNELDAEIYLRLHPYYENSAYTQQFVSDRIQVLSAAQVPEIMDQLDQMDLVLTDYSSIYVDYLFLDRPIVFIPYDLLAYTRDIGFMAPYGELTPGPQVFNFEDFLNALRGSLTDPNFYKTERSRLHAKLNGTVGHPCKECFDFISRTVQNL